jgi:hypothetical protein
VEEEDWLQVLSHGEGQFSECMAALLPISLFHSNALLLHGIEIIRIYCLAGEGAPSTAPSAQM